MAQSTSVPSVSGGRVRNNQAAANTNQSEAEFFTSIAQKVAENLLYHVDGRLGHSCGMPKPRDQQVQVESVPSSTQKPLDLTKYNFPSDFKLGLTASASTECAAAANGRRPQSSPRTTREIAKGSYVCSVCGQQQATLGQYNEHHANNHPNVLCGYYRVDAYSHLPSEVFVWQHCSPQGVLRNSGSIPSVQSTPLRCTKCDHSFDTAALLHEHIFECAKRDVKAAPVTAAATETPTTSEPRTQGSEQSSEVQLRRRRAAPPPPLPKKQPPSKRAKTETTPETPTSKPGPRSTKVTPKPEPPQPERKSKRLSRSPVEDAKDEKKDGKGSEDADKKETAAKLPVDARRKKKQDAAKTELPAATEAADVTKVKVEPADEPAEDSKQDEENQAEAIINGCEHSCDICKRHFKYLANYRKHLPNCKPLTVTSKESSSDPVEPPNEVTESGDKSEAQTDQSAAPESDEDTRNGDVDLSPAKEDQAVKPFKATDEPKPDLWKIKQENPQYAFKGSPAQHHSCPYCQRGFTYLANYRKHIKSICPIRQQQEDNQKNRKSKNEAEENGKDDVQSEKADSEDNQREANENSPQNEIPDDDKSKFKTFSCNICHKIYLSQFQMIRHRLSHKLDTASSAEGGSGGSQSGGKQSGSDEEQVAKKALIKHEPGTRNSKSPQKAKSAAASASIGNLLENLARGGHNDDSDTIEEEIEDAENGVSDDNTNSTEVEMDASDVKK